MYITSSLLFGTKLTASSHFLHLVFLLCFLPEFRGENHPKTFGGSPARKPSFFCRPCGAMMPHPEADPLCPDTPLCGAETAPPLLSILSEAARQEAMARFQIIQPFVERGVPLPEVARHHGVALRTARRWVQRYRAGGLLALSRTSRASRGIPRRVPPGMTQRIEALALQTPPLSVAAIHRQVLTLAAAQGTPAPSYRTVYNIIRRKPEPTWQGCGIPGILYTDHGADFTSQHLEQVCADLKIQAIFSQVGQPRGRGRIERFFNTVNQLLLARLPGYAPAGYATQVTPGLDLQGFTQAFEHFVLHEYHQTPHSATGIPPHARWGAHGFA